MPPQNQCISLELAKRLHALGVKGESYFKWYRHLNDEHKKEVWTINCEHNRPYAVPTYPAYTLSELIEMCGEECVEIVQVHKGRWHAVSKGQKGVQRGPTPLEAVGNLLAYLKEQGLM